MRLSATRISTLVIFFFLATFLLLPYNSQAKNTTKVGLVLKALTNPFYIALDHGAREYASEQGIPLEIFGLERETDVEHQISIMENLIARNYGVIIIAPSDSQRLIPICEKALKKGIQVINIDNPLDQKMLADQGISIPFIGPDNEAGGQLIGNFIQSKLNGQGRVLVVEGIPGAQNSDDRKNGFIKAVTKDSSIEIASIEQGNWHVDEAFSSVIKVLQQLGKIDAIFCANDLMALGALQALDTLGLTSQVLLTGYDNIDQVRGEMIAHRIDATVEQHPDKMGRYGVEAAWKSIHGIPLMQRQKTHLDLITSDLVGKKVVFTVSTLKNPFFATMVASAKKEAETFPMDIQFLDADNEDAQQLVQIVEATEKGADLLVINPTNSDTIAPAIEIAERKGVPIITVDRHISTGKVLSHIASDNEAGGETVADFIAHRLGERGTLLELEGIPGTSATHSRGVGFNKQIKKYPNITVRYREAADFDRQRASSIVKRLLDDGLQVDGAFAHNDNMILGLIDAYEATGKPLPKVLVGFDGIAESKLYIHNGKLSATIAQRPDIMGELAISTAAKYFRGDEIAKETPVALTLIDK